MNISSTKPPFSLLFGVVKLFQFPVGKPELAKMEWLLQLRWFATAFFFSLTALGLGLGYWDRLSSSRALGVVGIVFAFNLVTHFYFSHYKSNSKSALHPLTLCFQMAFDLLALVGFLAATGGFGNPLVALFLVNAAIGGVVIPQAYSWPFVLLVHSSLGFLQLLHISSLDKKWHGAILSTAALYHLMVFCSWFVMRSLGRYLESHSRLHLHSQIFLEKQDRLRAIGALASGFSHEFASPLNTARLRLSRALRVDSQNEDLAKAMEAIESCEHVLRQMNSSQMDTRDNYMKPVHLHELVNSVIESWKETHPEVQLNLELQTLSSLQLPVVNFAQVLLNLLDNAFEASPETPIDVQLTQTAEHTTLRVKDHGPGFSPLILQKLGEPFVTDKASGTGLGLYVSELFAQSLGGTLHIANVRPTGASVTLQWPTTRGEHA